MAQTLHKGATGNGRSLRIIRNLYLYLVAMIGLMFFLFGLVGSVNQFLKFYVFQVNDYYYVDPTTGSPCETQYMNYVTNEPAKRTPEEVEKCMTGIKEQADRSRMNEVGRELSMNIGQALVGLPVWLFHWLIIQRDHKRRFVLKARK